MPQVVNLPEKPGFLSLRANPNWRHELLRTLLNALKVRNQAARHFTWLPCGPVAGCFGGIFDYFLHAVRIVYTGKLYDNLVLNVLPAFTVLLSA